MGRGRCRRGLRLADGGFRRRHARLRRLQGGTGRLQFHLGVLFRLHVVFDLRQLGLPFGRGGHVQTVSVVGRHDDTAGLAFRSARCGSSSSRLCFSFLYLG